MESTEWALAFGMLCLMLGTLLTGFSRPLWSMLHRRGPDGRRAAPGRNVWVLRGLGFLLLLAAGCVIAMSIKEVILFS